MFRGIYTDGSQDPDFEVWLLVSISDGRETGYGECTPTSLYYEPGHIGRSGIDEWTCALDLARGLVGQDARRLGRLITEDPERNDANSVNDTFDFALHDLVGRRLGVPVAVLLGGVHRPFVYNIPVIHMDTPEGMARHAADEHRRYGFVYFKLKPIGEPEADIETLTRMRELMGPRVKYYMDANYALKITDPDRIVAYINRLADLGLEAYEDPINADLATYRYISERVRAKIMIDEHARTPAAILQIIREKAAGMINIHANWAGGFQPALRKAALAATAGMPAMIGSGNYLGPGAAAYQILSSVLPIEIPCEQTFYLTECPAKHAIEKPFDLRDGKSFIPDTPGLGVTVNMEVIAKLTVRQETFSG